MHLSNSRLLFYELFSPFGPGHPVIMAWDDQLRKVPDFRAHERT